MSGAWKVADVVAIHEETTTARTIRLRLPESVRSLAGQHVDVRLTAPDGYQAVRSYSVSAVTPAERWDAALELDITVDELPDGEVSPYLVRDLAIGDQLEVRGPVGGWFVWRPDDPSPVQLIGGGSGVVPLMAMARVHAAASHPAPFRLLYSVRTPESIFFRKELDGLARTDTFDVRYVYTRKAPDGEPVGRLDARTLETSVLNSGSDPAIYVCGATGFVEAVAGWLVDLGHSPDRIKTERYGGLGGAS